jgi:hypothetical protein
MDISDWHKLLDDDGVEMMMKLSITRAEMLNALSEELIKQRCTPL